MARVDRSRPSRIGFAIKHDGYRIMAERDRGSVRLYSRNGYDFADRFPMTAATSTTAARSIYRHACKLG